MQIAHLRIVRNLRNLRNLRTILQNAHLWSQNMFASSQRSFSLAKKR